MIEIIYKGEEKELSDELNLKLPKNIRQIGECEHYPWKIYVEDFVMTYVNHFSSKKLKYGVLLGDIKRGNGNTYIFITGVVTANAILDNDIVFDEDVWTGIYEDIKMYYEGVEIVGWFATMPSLLPNDMPNIQKLHIDNFAGNDRVCFLLDRLEGDENFFMYDDGGMKKCEGFYIYYEKNADMQSYMSMHVDERIIPDNYEQEKKRGINAKVHSILFNNETEKKSKNADSNKNTLPLIKLDPNLDMNDENNYLNEIFSEEKPKNKLSEIGKKLPSFAYSASSLMLIAILIGTIALMNASGQLKELKSAVVGLVGKEPSTEESLAIDESPSANIVDVTAGVSESASDTKNVNQETSPQDTTSEVVNETTQQPTNEVATTIAEETTAEQVTQEQTPATVSSIPKDKVYYVVKKGDSLYSISLKNYGNISMIQSILQANGLTDENFIREGETIILP